MPERPDSRRPTLVVALAVVAAVAVGMLVAFQSRINGELGARVGDGPLAALITFVAALIVLLLVLPFWRPGRTGLGIVARELRSGSLPWWYLAGGAGGALFVLTQTVTVALLGIALFTVATVSGQTISGLIIDRRGIGSMPANPLTLFRVAGSALALVAVALAVSAQLTGEVAWWALVLPFLAGIAVGWQQALNGQVRAVSGSVFTATFVNFVAGTVVLVVASAVSTAIEGWPSALPTEPWVYLGGFIGLVFIAVTAAIVRITGVLLVGLATVAGQLVMSVVLDVIFPVPGHVIAASTVAGTALTLVAVAIAAIPGGRMLGAPRASSDSPSG